MAIKELSNVQIKSGSDWYKLCPFPVGYIYMGYTSTSPATTYGGTWSSISGGRYFRAAAANDANGSNTIKIENMPSHKHDFREYNWLKIQGHEAGPWVINQGFPASVGLEGATDANDFHYVDYTGGGQKAFYPTYQNVYAWRRTA